MPDVEPPRPRACSCLSRSLRSRASARRLRKSERWTRPTVCDLSKSSAVDACEVKREVAALAAEGLGVLLREGSADEGFERSMVDWRCCSW